MVVMNPDDITQDHPSHPPSDRPRHTRQWLFEDPASPQTRMLRRRLITWVSVLALVGLLGGLWVRGGAEARARTRVFRGAVEADLTRLEVVQDAYFSERGRFASLGELGTLYISSQGVRVRIHRADITGWTASAWHLLTSRICILTVTSGAGRDAEQPGREPICR